MSVLRVIASTRWMYDQIFSTVCFRWCEEARVICHKEGWQEFRFKVSHSLGLRCDHMRHRYGERETDNAAWPPSCNTHTFVNNYSCLGPHYIVVVLASSQLCALLHMFLHRLNFGFYWISDSNWTFLHVSPRIAQLRHLQDATKAGATNVMLAGWYWYSKRCSCQQMPSTSRVIQSYELQNSS